jgi:hypothetical protein
MAAATVLSSKISPQLAMPRVGGQDDRAVLVAARDDLEEMGGGFAGHRQVAQLVDHQKLRSVPEAHRRLPAPLERGAAGACDEVCGGRVVDAVAGVHGLQAERDREHRLADAGRADGENVGLLFDEPQRRELVDEATIDRRLRGEVELLQRLGRGEPGEPQPAGEAAFSGRVDLDVEQVVQELRVAGLGLLRRFERCRELLGRGGELEVGEVAA